MDDDTFERRLQIMDNLHGLSITKHCKENAIFPCAIIKMHEQYGRFIPDQIHYNHPYFLFSKNIV